MNHTATEDVSPRVAEPDALRRALQDIDDAVSEHTLWVEALCTAAIAMAEAPDHNTTVHAANLCRLQMHLVQVLHNNVNAEVENATRGARA